MVQNKFLLVTMSALTALTLAACGDTEEDAVNPADTDHSTEMNQSAGHGEMDEEAEQNETGDNSGHSGMDHSSSGEVPDELQEADNPKFEVGSQAIIEADHMAGMDGAEATIAGAYDTTVYAVSFDLMNGGDPVENHKWVIHEELENPGEEPLEAGEEAILAADHMEGMKGATAEIDSAGQTTVYMVDFTATDTGEKVVNHKWVTESELSAE